MFAAARTRFDEAGILVLVPEAETVAICQDKAVFAHACAGAGIPTPRVVLSPSAADLPVFIRPRVGKGGIGARAVRRASELEAALDELGDTAFVQELVEAPEFTIDLFVDPRDGTPISCVVRERVLVIGGESHVGRTVRSDSLRDAALELAGAIGLTGHATIQAFRTADTTLLIEANPRYGGGAVLGFAAGADTADYAVRVAAGEALPARLDEHEVGLVMLRYTDADLFLHDEQLARAP